MTGLLLSIFGVNAQYYDDIYYDASKAKKEVSKIEKTKTQKSIYPADGNTTIAAPTYQVYNNAPRDVDEYNRRGGDMYAADTSSVDSLASADAGKMFQYTERIERFDNPNIVKSSDDETLKQLYYANDVNVFVGVPTTSISFGLGFADPWYSPWYTPWYSAWAWDYPYYGFGWGGWYRPYYAGWYGGWYDPFWGPGYWHGPHYPVYGWYGNPGRYSPKGRRPFGGNYGTHASTGGSVGRRPVIGRSYNPSYSGGRRPSIQTNSRPSVFGGSTQSQRFGNGRGGATYYNNGSNSSVGRRPSYTSPQRENRTWQNNTRRSDSYNRTTPSFERGNSGSFGGRSGSFGGGGGRGSFGGGRGGRR